MPILLFSIVLYCEKEEINQEGRRSVVNALEVEYLNPDPVISLLAKFLPLAQENINPLTPPPPTTTTDPRKGLM